MHVIELNEFMADFNGEGDLNDFTTAYPTAYPSIISNTNAKDTASLRSLWVN